MKRIPVGSILYFISSVLWLFLAYSGIGNWSTRVYIFLFIIFVALGFINWRMTDRANSD
ncbi:hypothetical protein [Halalkalibacter krulwichiae]|uniref:Uncharacterized protein n=1 Tax=Halalkalibacter krulwichiae TaxID=199441 RepID=A0A1X9MET4_9BACI|nr:hypothetical protein [Halalkalibacter krulwichiae]ARK31948.1 hypothetical protein BkAM31D_20050 [Halalkalibacter krulwichiae]